ncbi:hypothetical protein [Rhizobium sullae]|uniref:hypothetical protein n=1 Tax=Rhizobium sullae TaxID=50338 RepID=UPI000B362AE6|nr:hypothetical protein [Rhizobium sullae]
MEITLITGPAGVGKSTLCWEMSLQLATVNVAHTVIETDELDRNVSAANLVLPGGVRRTGRR